MPHLWGIEQKPLGHAALHLSSNNHRALRLKKFHLPSTFFICVTQSCNVKEFAYNIKTLLQFSALKPCLPLINMHMSFAIYSRNSF